MSNTKRPRLLLTNDDGYWAPGIRSLYHALVEDYELFVVAPDTHQSGCGHGVTTGRPLRYDPIPEAAGIPGVRVSGSPADCVKLALFHLLEKPPVALVSGMNLGENTGISSHYSGTLAAAREGAMYGIPSFAFSLSRDAGEHLQDYSRQARQLLARFLDLPPHAEGTNPDRIVYSVNFPDCSLADCRGTRVTRQSLAAFDDAYEWRDSEDGVGPGVWLTGHKSGIEPGLEYDSRALREGYTTITPLDLDNTSEQDLDRLRPFEG